MKIFVLPPFCFKIFVLFSFSKVLSIRLLLYYIKTHFSIVKCFIALAPGMLSSSEKYVEFMDKLMLIGQTVGRVFNSRLGCACICHAIAYITKRISLKLKTQLKQLLGSRPLAFVCPSLLLYDIKTHFSIVKCFIAQAPGMISSGEECLEFMAKLMLTGQTEGQVFNSRLGHGCISRSIAYVTEWVNLKLKTWPKQLLGSHPFAFTFPCLLMYDINTCSSTVKWFIAQAPGILSGKEKCRIAICHVCRHF
jgi:hypothetical protein